MAIDDEVVEGGLQVEHEDVFVLEHLLLEVGVADGGGLVVAVRRVVVVRSRQPRRAAKRRQRVHHHLRHAQLLQLLHDVGDLVSHVLGPGLDLGVGQVGDAGVVALAGEGDERDGVVEVLADDAVPDQPPELVDLRAELGRVVRPLAHAGAAESEVHAGRVDPVLLPLPFRRRGLVQPQNPRDEIRQDQAVGEAAVCTCAMIGVRAAVGVVPGPRLLAQVRQRVVAVVGEGVAEHEQLILPARADAGTPRDQRLGTRRGRRRRKEASC
uniref:Uncharacterized protein n=1 Tax=Arundo donax TaxID=35708 RepID=A0A0A9TNF5_ARUDO